MPGSTSGRTGAACQSPMRPVFVASTASKAAVNLASRSRMRSLAAVLASCRSMTRLRPELDDPLPRRVRSDTEDPHPADGVLDDRQDVQSRPHQRADLEEVAGQQRIGLTA